MWVGLEKMLKLGSFRMETHADRTLHVRECCRQHGRRAHLESQSEGTGQARTSSVFQTTRCVKFHFHLQTIIFLLVEDLLEANYRVCQCTCM